jgi:glycosyltransferase involved in cell wall biosynthesis
MTGTAPTISVVMPVYNSQGYLAAAVESILAQTFSEFELVAVDDGSTDGSLATLERLASGDTRIRIISRPNTGIVGALNDGLTAARGELVARMDADDVAMPDRFERQLHHLSAHPDCVAVGSAVLRIDPDGDPICIQPWALAHEEIDRLLLAGGGGLAHPTAMIRTAAIRQVGGYRREYEWVEDKDLWLRLAEIGRLANLPEPLLKYRLHENSVCWQRENEQRALWEKLLAETYERRGLLGPPPQFPPHCGKRPGPGRTRAKWIRAATRSGNYTTAAKHVRQLCRDQPWQAATWLAVLRAAIPFLLHRMVPRRI